jgi:transposase-like protein
VKSYTPPATGRGRELAARCSRGRRGRREWPGEVNAAIIAGALLVGITVAAAARQLDVSRS